MAISDFIQPEEMERVNTVISAIYKMVNNGDLSDKETKRILKMLCVGILDLFKDKEEVEENGNSSR